MKILTLNYRSATFELENSKTPYYSEKSFKIYLDGKIVREENRNVFSIYNLQRGLHTVCASDESTTFEVKSEDDEFNVTEFFARGDGVTDDTTAFQTAINCATPCSTIYVPAGCYLLRPLFLKSNIKLYLERGATLLGSVKREDYPVLPALAGKGSKYNFGTWQGEEADCFASLITAINQENIVICGEGVIDCNAQNGDWYVNHRVKRIAWRPRGIFLNGCKNVVIQGITVKNTPSWNLHPYFCKNVGIYDVTLQNPAHMPTTDGIDPDCSDGVEICGVNISVGDDCIAIKSGTLELAKKYRTPCKNIDIRNCLMRDGHGGVVLGSELSGGIENVSVEKCLFKGTDRGLRIKTRRGRGRIGKCDNISFENIVMDGVKVPFVINMYYNMGDETGHTEYVWTTEKLPVDDRTPHIGSFVFRNMECRGIEYSSAAFYGLPEAPIESVTFENVTFEYNQNAGEGFPDMREKNTAVSRQGLDFHFVENVVLNNISISGQKGDEVILEGVDNFTRK
jgi:polygalacturonase